MAAEFDPLVIVIEDHPDLNELLVEELADHGHRTLGFTSAEAYERSGQKGDLFLLDLNLPGEDGLSFAARLRANRPEAGIVVLSVRSGSEIRAESYETGIDLYLTKPCAPREIVAAVRAMARRLSPPVAAQASRMRQGLTLDRASLKLFGPEGETAISGDEAAFLSAIAGTPERRMDYGEILDIMGIGGDTSLATLEVRITRLRKKIAAVLPGEASIRSLRKRGYQLVLPLETLDA